jgi:hypothetical protein
VPKRVAVGEFNADDPIPMTTMLLG